MATQEIYLKGNSNDSNSLRLLWVEGALTARMQANIDGLWTDIDEFGGRSGGADIRDWPGVDITGAVSSTVGIQAAIDEIAALTYGGPIRFPPGTYLVGNLMLKQNVQLIGAWQGGKPSRHTSLPTRFVGIAGTTGWMLDTPDDGVTYLHGMAVTGIAFVGNGASHALGGVRFRRSIRPSISKCTFENFGDRGLYVAAEADVCEVDQCFAQRCLLIQPRTELAAAIEIDGNDSIVTSTEAAGSNTNGAFSNTPVTGTAQAGGTATITLASGESSVDDHYVGWLIELTASTGVGQWQIVTGYVGSTKVATVRANWVTQPAGTTTYRLSPLQNCAAILRGVAAQGWSDNIWETADAGLVVLNSSTPSAVNLLANNRCDLNSGPGFIVGGPVNASSLFAYRNGQGADNTYPGLLTIPGASGIINGLWSDCLATDSWGGNNYQQKYGVAIADATNKLSILNINGENNQTALIYNSWSPTSSAAAQVVRGKIQTFASGTSLTVVGAATIIRLTHASPATITLFAGLSPYTEYLIVSTASANILDSSANIVLAAGTDLTMVVGVFYRFVATSPTILAQMA